MITDRSSKHTSEKTKRDIEQDESKPGAEVGGLRPVIDDFVKSENDFIHLQKLHFRLGLNETSLKMYHISQRLHDLESRVRTRCSESKQGEIFVNYTDMLKKLTMLLGHKYYIDIYNHKDVWENADSKIKMINDALDAFDARLIADIKSVNSNDEIDFNVAINALNVYNPQEDNKSDEEDEVDSEITAPNQSMRRASNE